MKTKLKSNEWSILLSSILVVSIMTNIYSIFKIFSYKYNIGKESYVKIEEIRQRNEGIMDILNTSLDSGSIRNEEILKLYKNYDIIASDIIKLWEQYSDYNENSISIFAKNIESDKVIQNIHGKIKEYVLSILSKEMKNNQNKFILTGLDLECFKEMEDMSVRIYNYFNEFNENTLNGYTGDMKKKKIIKNHYWIDMLKGIYDISNDYIEVDWKIEVEDQLSTDLNS